MNFTPLFAIFFIIATGFFAKKVGIVEQKHSIPFVDFVLCFAMPALIFDKIYHVNVDASLINTILIGFASTAISAALAFVIGKIFKFTKITTVSMVMLSLFGNTLFVGMPVIQGFFGDAMVNEVIFYDQIATGIPLSILGPLILSFAAPEKVSLFQNTMKILKFPPFIALIMGLILKEVPLPDFIFAPLRMFECSVTPVALFAIGVGLNFSSITSSYKGVSVVLLCKMILPAIVFFIILKVSGIQMSKTWVVGLFQCAMPTSALASAMVIKAGLDSSLAISSVAIGVLFSFITLPVIYFVFA